MSNLQSTFKSIISTRKSVAFILGRTPLELLNTIPNGQNNNIVWNAGHIIAVQQLLVNRKSGYQYTEDKLITQNFRPGTAPEGVYDQAIVDHLKERLLSNAIDMEKTFLDGLYGAYDPFTTRTKIELTSVEDAINFELMHSGLHLGYIMSYLNVLAKK